MAVLEGRPELVGQVRDSVAAGGSVLLSGPAGIGKSTLLDGVVKALDGQVRVLRCAAAQADAQLPFVSLIDIFSSVGDDALAELSTALRRAVDAALMRGELSQGQPDPLAVRLGMLQVLRALGRREPLVIVVDDVQWMDAPSAEVLGFAARRLDGSRVSVVAAVRGEGHDATRFLELLPSGAVELIVGPLPDEVLAPLVVERAGGKLPGLVASEVCKATQGNPLFALEIAAALARRRVNLSVGEPLPVPVELRRLMVERLAALSSSARDVLLVASALGRPTVHLLHEAGCTDVVAALEAAHHAGVAQVDIQGFVSFSHPLMRSAVYEEASLVDVMAAHGRLAEVVQEPVEQARHVALSSAAEDEQVAVTLDKAAIVALERGATGLAAELAHLAADRTPRGDVDSRADRLLTAGWNYYRANRWEDAQRTTLGALDMFPSRTIRARALIQKLHLFGQQIALESDTTQAALADAEGVPLLEANALIHSAFRYMSQGRVDLAMVDAKRAVAAANAANNLETLTQALDVYLISTRIAGSDEYEPAMERALALVDQSMTPETWRSHRIFARHVAGQGRYAEARAAIHEALRLVQEYGDLSSIANVLSGSITIEVLAGDYPAAMDRAAELAVIAETGDRGSTLYGISLAELAGGSAQRARDYSARGVVACERHGDVLNWIPVLYTLGAARLMLGAVGGTIESLRAARDMNLKVTVPYALGYPWAPQLAEALLLAGNVQEARAILDEGFAAVRTRKAYETRDVRETMSDLERVAALAEAAGGRLDEAADHLEDLIERLRDRAPIEIARTQLALAGVERRRRHRGTARNLLMQARQLCERSGAAPWLPLIDAELDRIDTPHHQDERDALTPVEARVVGMVVNGATNREIAGALSISVKTVEATLSRVYRKTGTHSRLELIKSRS